MQQSHPLFQPWPKIARLNRDIIISEKIDGTNAAIHVYPETVSVAEPGGGSSAERTGRFLVRAQSRTRIVTPQDDNYGFAAWVASNAELLVKLGEGLHFGEWWGRGIQRGYDKKNRTFSLFNTTRWNSPEGNVVITELQEYGVSIDVVPVLYEGPRIVPAVDPAFCEDAVEEAITNLKTYGSRAAAGYKNPEGVVVFHTAANMCFKVTVEKDEAHKGTYPGMHSGAAQTGRIVNEVSNIKEIE